MNNSTHIHMTIDKMAHFLKRHKLPQFIQYETSNLNSLIAIKTIEFTILKLPKRKLQAQIVSLENFTKCLMKN